MPRRFSLLSRTRARLRHIGCDFVWVIGMVTLMGSTLPAAVVSLPDDAGGPPASSSIVPFLIDDAEGILGADIRISYDPAVALATAVSKTALSSSHTLTTNLLTPGVIIISLFGATPLSGGGSLIDISFDSVGALNDATVLDIISANFNEGTIGAQLVDGSFCVQDLVDEVQFLRVDLAAPGSSAVVLTWQADPVAESYNVYRATLFGGTAAGSDALCGTADDNLQLFGPDGLCGTADDTTNDLSCFQSGLLNTTVNDGDSPALTGIFFYLVTAKNCRSEATLGFRSDGSERASLGPCP